MGKNRRASPYLSAGNLYKVAKRNHTNFNLTTHIQRIILNARKKLSKSLRVFQAKIFTRFKYIVKKEFINVLA